MTTLDLPVEELLRANGSQGFISGGTGELRAQIPGIMVTLPDRQPGIW